METTPASGLSTRQLLLALVTSLVMAAVCAVIWWVVPMLITQWVKSEMGIGVGYIGMFFCLPVGALLGVVSGLLIVLLRKGRWWSRLLIALAGHAALAAAGAYLLVS